MNYHADDHPKADQPDDRLDGATSRRLARLGTMPVDMGRLVVGHNPAPAPVNRAAGSLQRSAAVDLVGREV